MTPPMTPTGLARSSAVRPAATVVGQAATHLPQRVQASIMVSTRLCRAASKVSGIVRDYSPFRSFPRQCSARRIAAKSEPISRMRRSTKWCAAVPGSYQTPSPQRSRVCSASFRFASCCAAPGKRRSFYVSPVTPGGRLKAPASRCKSDHPHPNARPSAGQIHETHPHSRPLWHTKSCISRAQRSTERFSGVVRCRPGIVTNAESAKVPDQRRTAARCTASGKRG